MAFSHLFLLNSLLFLLNFFVPGGAFRLQGVGVKGTLLCNGAFSVHTNAAIFDVDRNPGDADDLLDKGHSDRKGRFVLEGTTRELTNIEPELRIIHDCADGIKVGGYAGGDGKDAFGGGGGMFSRLEPCHRLLVIKVPSEYINSGKVHKIFDIGTVDLAEKRQDEQRVCQNDF
ncbi:hypothetical protein GPALN_007974 [Globodera pallida]|nr:hypothetical protein GPALN_007976 [Globodera pallida]KAI3418876.1 hypothetical protein GPALN_007974 [Globodera pallida]